jgi:hypothetical protein
MDKQDQSALREQYQAPDLTNVASDLLAYIERLEQGIVDLARIRQQYADFVWHMMPPPKPDNDSAIVQAEIALNGSVE